MTKYTYKLTMVKDESVQYAVRKCNSSETAAGALRAYLQGSDREKFVILAMDTQNTIIGLNLCSMGALDSTIVHPREVLKFAILANASGIVVGHNHPSGNTEPSQEDIKLTNRLAEACRLIGIDFHDHIIIGHGSAFFSMAGAGHIKREVLQYA